MTRFQKCCGWTLFRWGRWQGELWFCPRGERIPMHRHPKIASRLFFLGGEMVWRRGHSCALLNWKRLGHSFRVQRDQPHGASVTGRFGVFFNLEKWTEKPTSAAIDFVLT